MPPSRFSSLRTKSHWLHQAELSLFIVLGLIFAWQARTHFQKFDDHGASVPPAIRSLQGCLSEISDALLSYLENHDARSLALIGTQGKEMSQLMAQFESGSSPSSHGSALLKQGQEALRAATLMVLSADQAAVAAQLAFAGSHDVPRTRSLRHRAKASQTIAEPAEKMNEELRQAEDNKQRALDRFRKERRTLESTLRQLSSPRRSAWDLRTWSEVLFSGLDYMLIGGFCIFLGIIFVYKSDAVLDRQLMKPLQEILLCVEAAAAGDVSRVPEHWASNEVGQLSQAVGRMITVLARSENLVYHLAALVESSGEAIISYTLDGTVLSWNKGAQRIYGYSAEEMKGRSITLLAPYDNGAEMQRYLEKIQRGERLQPFETIHQARNGRTVRALVRVSAILDSTRKVIGASFCAQDLTDTAVIKQKATEDSQTV